MLGLSRELRTRGKRCTQRFFLFVNLNKGGVFFAQLGFTGDLL